jgi:hypothetical protein
VRSAPSSTIARQSIRRAADTFFARLAAVRSSDATLRCEVRQGDFRDAILASAAVNATHGQRRTNADKRIAVGKLLQDPEWAKWSDCEIARRCKVSDVFVGRLRDSLTPNVRSERSYITKYGTVAAMNIAAVGRGVREATPTVRIFSRPDDCAGEVMSLTRAARSPRATRRVIG